MDIRIAWIPKSEKGRQVAQYLREQGFAVRNTEIVGHYACNLPCAQELTPGQWARIAFILEPEGAFLAEQTAFDTATAMRDHLERYGGDYMGEAKVLIAADAHERNWAIGG